MPRGDDAEFVLRERLAKVETQIVGLASASSILNGSASAEIVSLRVQFQQEIARIRSEHGEHVAKIAKLEAIAERFELIEERIEKVRQDVTGSHRLVVDPRKSEPPKHAPVAHVEAAWAASAKVWGPIVIALIALLATLVNWIVHQH